VSWAEVSSLEYDLGRTNQSIRLGLKGVDELVAVWPDGERTTLPSLSVGQTVRIARR